MRRRRETEVHLTSVAKGVPRGYAPAEGLFPREHIPLRLAAARARYADILELETDDGTEGPVAQRQSRARHRRQPGPWPEMCPAFGRAGADVIVASRDLAQCELVAAEVEDLGREVLAVSCHVGRWDRSTPWSRRLTDGSVESTSW